MASATHLANRILIICEVLLVTKQLGAFSTSLTAARYIIPVAKTVSISLVMFAPLLLSCGSGR